MKDVKKTQAQLQYLRYKIELDGINGRLDIEKIVSLKASHKKK